MYALQTLACLIDHRLYIVHTDKKKLKFVSGDKKGNRLTLVIDINKA